MKVKELIEKIEALPAEDYKYRPYIDKKVVLCLVRQLDESQKPVIPQFVADWIETAKKAAYNIRGAIDLAPKGRVKDWLELKNVNTFAKAWVNGYEVEKEKRYLVKIKGEIEENCLVYGLGIKRYFFTRVYDSSKRNEHTRKQLEEAGFGWVFSCEGIEIEEVEE